MNLDKLLRKYDYQFPKELIANAPATPRDNARLLVYDRKKKTTIHGTFSHLSDYLPKNAVLVFNETKVLPARLMVTKETGGKVRLLYLGKHAPHIKALADRSLHLGSILTIAPNTFLKVIKRTNSIYTLKPSFALKETEAMLARFGSVPLPPYIKNAKQNKKQLETDYQAVFAKHSGSVAAPTASLHFTKRLIRKLEQKGVTATFITLHVGLGTFASLTEENIKNRKLHKEQYSISKNTARVLNKAKKEGRPIIAVGTTSLRALESASTKGKIIRLAGETDIFIQEGHTFRFIDGLITNFHVPRSSLLMLVSAIAGRKNIMNIYKNAIDQKYRLFSFGDGMLIL